MHRFEVDLGGKSGVTEFRLESGAVTMTTATRTESRPLEAIQRLRLLSLGKTCFCEVHDAGGEVFSISNGMEGEADGYRGFVEALHEQMADRSDVEFVSGSWGLVAVYVGVALLLVGTAAALTLGWIEPPSGWAGRKANAITWMAGLAVVVGPFVFPKFRPKAYDPRQLPSRYMPAA